MVKTLSISPVDIKHQITLQAPYANACLTQTVAVHLALMLKHLEGGGRVKVENKEGFVRDLNDLLIKHGAGRYDYLKETPMEYTRIVSQSGGVIGEIVTCCGRSASVNLDSLPAMMADIYTQGVI